MTTKREAAGANQTAYNNYNHIYYSRNRYNFVQKFDRNLLPTSANYYTISKQRLATCDNRLQKICIELLVRFDHSIDFGSRTHKEQEYLVKKGRSKTLHSKHCLYPSRAVDVCPYPRPKDLENPSIETLKRFHVMAGRLLQIADDLKIPVRWGGDWNCNNVFNDQTFYDLFHFELLEL